MFENVFTKFLKTCLHHVCRKVYTLIEHMHIQMFEDMFTKACQKMNFFENNSLTVN